MIAFDFMRFMLAGFRLCVNLRGFAPFYKMKFESNIAFSVEGRDTLSV